ncbi:complement factor H-like [Centroberyx gerrardi]
MQLSLILLFLQLWVIVDVSLSQNVCSMLPDVPHAFVSEDSKKSEYQQGDILYFTCETGYVSGPTITYVCTTDGWATVRHGKCSLKPCELPDDTPNGQYQIIHGDDFVFGTIIKYMCNEGYHMVSKVDTRTCLLNKWTNHLPICEPLSCAPPPADGGVTVKGLPDNDGPILADRFLTFSCDGPRKYLNGSSELICGTNGEWSSPFPSCEDITCKAEVMHPHLIVTGLPSANEKMKQGHKLQFQCGRGYSLEGVKEVECLQTGQWNARFPTCSAPVGCGRPPVLEGGDIKDSVNFRYDHGERVEYVCQSYYTLDDVKCTAPVIENGRVLGNISEYQENEILRFQCNDKFKPTENRSPTCTKIGLRAEWSPTPLCEPITCSLTLPPIAGTSYEPNSRSVFSPGDTVTVTCAETFWIFTRADTVKEVTCKDDGTWDESLVCQEVTCANPRDNLVDYWGQHYWQTKKLDDTVSYRCRAGYKTTDGRKEATCRRDGWTPKPLCQAPVGCGRPPLLADGDIKDSVNFRYDHGERVEYVCQSYYTLDEPCTVEDSHHTLMMQTSRTP